MASLGELYEREKVDGVQRMCTLAHLFPTLRHAPRWETPPFEFARWATLQDLEAACYAASFCLTVWNGSGGASVQLGNTDPTWFNSPAYGLPVFDVVKAMGYWDQIHRAAFLTWCTNPFWP